MASHTPSGHSNHYAMRGGVRQLEDDCDDHLPYVMLAYRSTVHGSTGCSLSLIMLGREMNLPIDLLYPHIQPGESPQCATAYAQ